MQKASKEALGSTKDTSDIKSKQKFLISIFSGFHYMKYSMNIQH